MNRILIRSLETQALALIALFSLAVGCQARQSSSATSDTKQWTIEGDVMDGTQPVPGASVWWGGPGPNRTVESDGRGHYVLSGSNRARAWISAGKDGYCEGPQKTVSAEPGTRVEHMDLVIHKEGTISGRVLDPEGNGLEGAEVALYEKVFKEGKPSAKFTGVSHTNDLGEYRIAGVCAGPSFLFATPPLLAPHKLRPSAANRRIPGTPRPGIERRMYYPNAESSDGAQAIYVQPGQQVEGMDFQFRNTATLCVSAKAAADNSFISLRGTIESGGMPVGTGRVNAQDAFEICGIPPGQYVLMVISMNEAQSSTTSRIVAFSRTEFALGKEDMALGELPYTPTFSLSGSASVAGKSPEEAFPSGLFVQFKAPADRSVNLSESWFARVAPTGAFELPLVLSGDYQLEIHGLPSGYYVKQFTQNGRDVRFGGVRPELGPVSIVLGSDGATVNGTVTAKDGTPLHDVLVVLMPKQTTVGDEILSQPSDQDGRFNFATGVRPDEYYLIAFSGLIEGQQQNLEFMRANIKNAQEVTLLPRTNRSVVLSVEVAHNSNLPTHSQSVTPQNRAQRLLRICHHAAVLFPCAAASGNVDREPTPCCGTSSSIFLKTSGCGGGWKRPA